MSVRTIAMSLTLAIIGCFWYQPGLAARLSPKSSDEAKQDLTLPQNFRVSELGEGPGRFQVSLVYEWDRAMKQGTSQSYTEYTLNKSCTYKFSGRDMVVGRPSGLTVMRGPGPKYRVEAVCNCIPPANIYISPTVMVYGANTVVYMANPPGTTHPSNPALFEAPCKRPY